ncbi:MAG: amidohydrolase family protein [Phycisphaerales bacterium]|nr:amidohydrolase family protein [Phycisphaerales bacterium]
MIVDCHTQVWDPSTEFSRVAAAPPVEADEERHLEASDPVDKSIVLAFKSNYLGAEIPNRFVSEYVRRNPAKMIGFAGIDPTDRAWRDALREAQEDLQLKGVLISPEMQNFHPSSTAVMKLYEECMRRGMPVVFEQHHRNPVGKLEFAEPMLLDEVAQEFPDLRMVISRMGHPWVEQTVVLLAKHRHVYADVAGLLPLAWRSYTALLAAHEYGVMEKLLFGSDFPYRSPAACIEALYSVNQFCHGSNLAPIPREQLRGIVERNALDLLGIQGSATPARPARSAIFADDE